MEFISKIQREIVLSPSNLKLINGCAGSRKTDTLIKCGLEKIERGNLLFLTLVSSVTDEIRKRLEKMLGIKIERQYGSNHYIGHYKNRIISIANFDAWIHKQLEYLGVDLTLIGDCHNLKTRLLVEKVIESRCGNFILKNGEIANIILIDEFQDIEPEKVKILIEIYKNNPNNNIYVVGDVLQTIFENSVTSGVHPMNLFKTINPTYYTLNKCYRCPKAHINFCNLIMQDYQKKYNIKPITSENKDTFNKPMLFTHGNLSKNCDALYISLQIVSIIDKLLDLDKYIKPYDIAIIMKKSNDNMIYEQIKYHLDRLYKSRGYKNGVHYFKTRCDGYHNTIDWSKGYGKTVLLSIHGDKGKGHKVVFFLGLSVNSIPRDNSLFKDIELLELSLLNVALTRSTKYLFIGITKSSPSPYLSRYHSDLASYCYCSWLPKKIKNYKYKNLIYHNNEVWSNNQEYSFPYFWRTFRELPLKGPNKNILSISDSIAKNYESVRDIYPQFPNPTLVEFGKVISFRQKLNDDLYPFIGLMGELVIMRRFCPQELTNTLKPYLSDKIMYTDDERILSRVYDSQLNRLIHQPKLYTEKLLEVIGLVKGEDDLILKLLQLRQERKLIVHSSFDSNKFREELGIFLEEVKNEEISSSIWWNVTLFYNEIKQTVRKPSIYVYIDYFNEDLTSLHKNIEGLVGNISNNLKCQLGHSLLGKITDKLELKKRNFHEELDKGVYENGYEYGIRGKSDIYDVSNSSVIEIKTSHKVDFSREWVIQVFLYFLIKPEGITYQPTNMKIINILQGKLYSYQLDRSSINISQLIGKILESGGFDKKLVDNLIKKNNFLCQ